MALAAITTGFTRSGGYELRAAGTAAVALCVERALGLLAALRACSPDLKSALLEAPGMLAAARNASGKSALAARGAAAACMAALQGHSEVAAEQREACRALANLTSSNRAAKAAAAKAGACEAMPAALRSFGAAPSVAEPTCLAMANLTGGSIASAKTGNSPGGAAEAAEVAGRRRRLASGGAGALVLRCMGQNARDDVALAHAGCCALGALSGSSGKGPGSGSRGSSAGAEQAAMSSVLRAQDALAAALTAKSLEEEAADASASTERRF
jgi:hypothetical protein